MFPLRRSVAMSTSGGGVPVNPDEHVTDLLQNLNLTTEEGDVASFSDDEEDGEISVVDLSPAVVHATTIYRAMKPAWGNPNGLKIRTVGEKEITFSWQSFRTSRTWSGLLGDLRGWLGSMH